MPGADARRRSPRPQPPGAALCPPGPRLSPPSPNLRPPPPPSRGSTPLSPARPRSARAPLSHPGFRNPGAGPASPPPGAMGAPPGYRPSAWVHLLHQLPRADFQLRPVSSGFAPQEQEYQQVGVGTGSWGRGLGTSASGSHGGRELGDRSLRSPGVGAVPRLWGV